LAPNFANLSFGPQNLAVGQELVVHGTITPSTSQTGSTTVFNQTLPATVVPSAIFLKYQSMQGTLGSMLSIGSDNLTGAFVLNPCCTLLQGAPIYVLTNNQTNYVNAGGLGSLTSNGSLVVKGLPIYEPNSMVINGVTIPAGTMVLQAKQVHVLAP
jgi:hypothetical protein